MFVDCINYSIRFCTFPSIRAFLIITPFLLREKFLPLKPFRLVNYYQKTFFHFPLINFAIDGFSDAFRFDLVYNKVLGMSPNTYREHACFLLLPFLTNSTGRSSCSRILIVLSSESRDSAL